MSEKIIFATGNAGKLKEIREILKDLNREIVTMREAGFEGRDRGKWNHLSRECRDQGEGSLGEDGRHCAGR